MFAGRADRWVPLTHADPRKSTISLRSAAPRPPDVPSRRPSLFPSSAAVRGTTKPRSATTTAPEGDNPHILPAGGPNGSAVATRPDACRDPGWLGHGAMTGRAAARHTTKKAGPEGPASSIFEDREVLRPQRSWRSARRRSSSGPARRSGRGRPGSSGGDPRDSPCSRYSRRSGARGSRRRGRPRRS